MTERMSFRETGSERFPLPLAMAIYGEVPEVEEVRELVESRLEEDPVAALEGGLVLLELYEGNQAGVEEYVPTDGAFLGMAFNTKRQNGWIGVLGAEDPAEVEKQVNEQWKFKLVEGRKRRTGLYALLNMVVRYGFVYGKIELGDSHAMGHFVEDFAPALLVCRSGMDDLELTLSLAAMKIGLPAVVPEAYPFPLGRQARVEDLKDLGVATVVFANIRRLMDFPELPVLPEYLDASYAGEEFAPAVRWGAGGEADAGGCRGGAGISEVGEVSGGPRRLGERGLGEPEDRGVDGGGFAGGGDGGHRHGIGGWTWVWTSRLENWRSRWERIFTGWRIWRRPGRRSRRREGIWWRTIRGRFRSG